MYGSIENIRSGDPVFIIRRATSYRTSTSRHCSSVPLHEIAISTSPARATAPTYLVEGKLKQHAKKVFRSAQLPVRHNMLSSLQQSNSVRGVDVLVAQFTFRCRREDVFFLSLMPNLHWQYQRYDRFLSDIRTELVKDPIDSSTRTKG